MQPAIVSSQLHARLKVLVQPQTYCGVECVGRRPPHNRNLPERVAHVFAKGNVTRSRVNTFGRPSLLN